MTEELIKKDIPVKIKLGNKEYKLSPFNLNVMVGIEEEFDCSLNEVGNLLDTRQAVTLRKLIYILLKDDYPEITKAQIGQLITLKNFEEVSNQIAKVLTGE